MRCHELDGNKRKKLLILIISWAVPSALFFADQRVREKDLPQKYREWLKLVSYIILPQEKEVFSLLTNDRDRDIFIQSFWKQRDPTPGTPQNEYQEEHIKRFQYANKYFSRGTPREGWMTDMGRIHILLGPPTSIERFEGTSGIYPCQVWYYYGDQSKGLPTYFALVFFQRGGGGEFKLYNPTTDGPASLLIETRGLDVTNYEKIYERIRELAPTLAPVSISMIPGQYPYNFTPSPQNNIILANIFESPKRDVSPAYATHFLRYKGIVSTEYLTNYVESNAEASLLFDPALEMAFVHFAVAPKSVSVDYFAPRDQHYCNFRIDVSLRKGETIIYQYAKDFPFYFPPDRVETVRASGVCIQDSFPIIEGKYNLTVLLQNAVGKEFTLLEKEIALDEAGEAPKILGYALGYKLEEHPASTHAPFKTMGKVLSIDPSRTISAKEEVALFCSLDGVSLELWKEGKMVLRIQGLREKEPASKIFSFPLASYSYNKRMNLALSVPASSFPPDYYELGLELQDGTGKSLARTSSNFIISPLDSIPHPVTLSRSLPMSSASLYLYSLAHQSERVGDEPRAQVFFERALASNPKEKQGVIDYANFLLKTQKFDRAAELIERIGADENLRFDYYLIKGKALEGQGKYEEAIRNLLEGNKIYDSDTRLLNSLGFCYYKTRQKKAALEALQASLRLNPEQSFVRELVERVEKELK